MPVELIPVQPAMCGSCIFRGDNDKRIVTPERMADIMAYSCKGEVHICHYPAAHGRFEKDEERACRGARDVMLLAFYRLGIIAEPTDAALEQAMRESEEEAQVAG